MCSSRKNPYPPNGRSLEIPRGRGVLKAKILEAKYEVKLEFPGGTGGAKQKTFHGGSMDIFWNCTFECHKTKLKVMILLLLITTDVNSTMNQSELKANTCNQCQARENASKQVKIGFGFNSDWLTKWQKFCQPVREHCKAKPKQMRNYF